MDWGSGTSSVLTSLALVGGALIAIPSSPAQAQQGVVYAQFGTDANNVSGLMVGRLGGPAPKVVYPFSQGSGGSSPAVSPDGTRVAFIETVNGGNQVAVINADGSKHLFLTARERLRQGPVWSPDGRRVYFSVRAACPVCGRIFVVPADGSASPTAVPHGDNADPDALSHDGELIAIDYPPPPDHQSERLGVMGLDGSNRHGIGPKFLFSAAWRPGTHTLAVAHTIQYAIPRGPVIIQVIIINAATGKWRALNATQSPSKNGTAYPLAWSSDGTFLYYEHFVVANGDDQQSHPRIYRIRADGTDRTDVTPKGFVDDGVGGFAMQGR